MEMIEKAQQWAMEGHKGVNRKFTDLPYIVHPEAVAQIVAEVTDGQNVIAAAWLHDIVEDTDKTMVDIVENFNMDIAGIVFHVSKVSSIPKSGNREQRITEDREHYAQGSKYAKLIKLADCIHNLPTMIRDNPDFTPTYVREKELLLEVIKDGSPLLASIVYHIIEDFYEDQPVNDVSLRMSKISLTL